MEYQMFTSFSAYDNFTKEVVIYNYLHRLRRSIVPISRDEVINFKVRAWSDDNFRAYLENELYEYYADIVTINYVPHDRQMLNPPWVEGPAYYDMPCATLVVNGVSVLTSDVKDFVLKGCFRVGDQIITSVSGFFLRLKQGNVIFKEIIDRKEIYTVSGTGQSLVEDIHDIIKHDEDPIIKVQQRYITFDPEEKEWPELPTQLDMSYEPPSSTFYVFDGLTTNFKSNSNIEVQCHNNGFQVFYGKAKDIPNKLYFDKIYVDSLDKIDAKFKVYPGSTLFHDFDEEIDKFLVAVKGESSAVQIKDDGRRIIVSASYAPEGDLDRLYSECYFFDRIRGTMFYYKPGDLDIDPDRKSFYEEGVLFMIDPECYSRDQEIEEKFGDFVKLCDVSVIASYFGQVDYPDYDSVYDPLDWDRSDDYESDSNDIFDNHLSDALMNFRLATLAYMQHFDSMSEDEYYEDLCAPRYTRGHLLNRPSVLGTLLGAIRTTYDSLTYGEQKGF